MDFINRRVQNDSSIHFRSTEATARQSAARTDMTDPAVALDRWASIYDSLF
jgi:hypothetical protein